MASVLKNIYKCLIEIETTLINSLLQRFSPGQVPALINLPESSQSQPYRSLQELLQESVLWAVPKKRRSAEKVRNRRFGLPGYNWKPLVPKQNIVVCRNCGNYQERGLLCPACYKKVMDETKEIQQTILKELGSGPIEEDVIILYENENKEDLDPKMWKGKRIVEMKKPPPKIFSDNLLESSTEYKSDRTDVIEVPHPLEYK
ncbi:UNVERIFIED_CONTAM: hypothetical protein PYX00_008313 [Menopon gallinae]|uniref:Large ribosomal subunit protein bL32m n=2 Tax=Menopon gallinae TaxID=328185 RepID=A0AAW2HNR3_9NEOP